VKNKQKTVNISAELYDKIKARIGSSGFSSVDEYVAFVLEQVIQGDEPETKMSEADEAEVKKRLKALGYLE
jgi:Arc/MetJ-type ribon-helix-helix transcriptional regulator